MKFFQILISVAILHVVVIAVILLQPGCQTRQTPPPPPAGATPLPGTGGGATSRADYVPSTPARTTATLPVDRQEPMRPIDSAGYATDLPSAYNGGLDSANGGLLVPQGSGYEDDTLLTPEMEPYTVVPGDTLSGIARRFGISVAELRGANDLSSDVIRVDQTLMIPSAPAGSGTSGGPALSSTRDAGGEPYVVKAGDNLSSIARRNNLGVAELKAFNRLDSDLIKVGDTLYLPQRNSTFTPPPPAPRSGPVATNDGSTYVVQPGDTPITIARRLGVTHQELMRVNGISDPTRMQVGQVLIVPGARTGSTPPPAPRPSTPPRTTTPTPTPTPTTTQPPLLRPQPTRPAVIDGSTIDPADLDTQMGDDLPVSPVEVVEPTGDEG